MLKKTNILGFIVMLIGFTISIFYFLPISKQSLAQNKNIAMEKQKEPLEKVKTISLSSTVQLSFVEKQKEKIIVEINNYSDKEITAYQIGLDNGAKLLVDRSISGIYIKSNKQFNQEIPLPQNEEDETISEVILETVVFNDDSSEGNKAVALYIKNYRTGIKGELEKLIPSLVELDSNLKSVMVSEKSIPIKTAKKKIEKLSSKIDGESKGVNEGIVDAKQTVLNLLSNLEKNLSQEDSIRIYSYGVYELKEWLKRLSK